MRSDNLATMKGPRRAIRYGVAAAAMATALALTRIPVIGPELGPLIFLAIFFGAWYGGIGAGIFATLFFEGLVVGLRIYAGEPSDAKFFRDLFLIFFLGAAYSVLIELVQAARRRAEGSRQWLSAVLTSIGDAVIATDHDGRVVLMNPVAEGLCGWPASEASGHPLDRVFRIVAEDTREPIASPAARALQAGAVVGPAHHALLVARDGRELPIDDGAAPIRGPGGRIEGAVLVFRDITERRRIEARAAEEARRKDEFLAMLAHELRNPLAAISNAVHLLASPAAADSHDWSRDVLARQVRQLTRLVDDLLDVSRISRGKILLRPHAVDLTAVVRSAAEVVRPLVAEHGHDLRLSIAHGPIEVMADPARIEQVLVNLLNNAAKYTEPGGRIELQLLLEPGHAVVRVADTGIGIAPELLPRVFDLFTQGDRALSRSEGGLGIGLTMVQKLVELHGGRVEVRSDGPGRGSVFIVRLPMPASAPARPDPAVDAPPESATPPSPDRAR